MPSSTEHHAGGFLIVLSGVKDQTQQVAVVERSVAAPEAAVIATEILFDRAGWRPAFDLVAGSRPEVEAVLAERGFQVVVARPGMLCDLAERPLVERTSSAIIESASRIDRAGIVTVQQDAFDLSTDTAFGMVPEAMFTDPAAVVLVARSSDGEVVGSVTVHLDGRIGAIIGLAVSSAHRRRGIGTALTAAGLDVAHGRGVETVWLQATPDGQGIYEALGFVSVGSCEVWLR